MVLAAESMPFPGDFLCAAVTRSGYPMNYELEDRHWTDGGQPTDEESYCSPWLLNTLKTGQVRFRQGRRTRQFTDCVASDAVRYLEESSGASG
ncbi:hypothetical protein NGM10_10245 [Halorussus salilacus]|uniref:hypothetical protein n=1 Tax=Halorussus salilacus TaxID=2953750 RepID=UPI0020A1B306|nr:hypothetical protein [Halorussus salilacus]USZ67109.1 hypothetical protein NGM10_10245 [Halorussus salilacus]